MCGRLKNFVNLTKVKSKTEDAMNIEEFREYCLSLPGVTEKMPFTALNDAYSRDVLCFYVGSKWFCYVNIVLFDRCCVKSTPEEAAELRARYEGVRPAWHMNKRMWSDVYFGSDVSDALDCRLVENSYRMVRDTLPTKERETLKCEAPQNGLFRPGYEIFRWLLRIFACGTSRCGMSEAFSTGGSGACRRRENDF